MQGSELTAKQLKAITALLDHPTMKEAATAAGVNESTLWRWLQESTFQSAYRTARRQVVEHSISELQTASTEAVAALRRNLTCGQASVEVRAAQVILEQSIKAVELMDIEERLAALEAATKPAASKLRKV